MEQWYIPITILPGVGLLIMSTSNLLGGLNMEIAQLISEDCTLLKEIIKRKIEQLNILNISLVAQYLSAGALVLAGISSAINNQLHFTSATIGFVLMLLAVLVLLFALALLILFSLRAVKIKKARFEIGLQKGK